jgi:hypothetical protein
VSHEKHARGSQDVWIHVITFVLCAATAACGGYRLHNEYNMNVAQTLSILVRRPRARAACGRAAHHARCAFLLLPLRASHSRRPGCMPARRGPRALLRCAVARRAPGCADRRRAARTLLPTAEADAALHAHRRGAGRERAPQAGRG